MIREDFLVLDKQGLYCRSGNFYLDPQSPVKHAVISHAHGDHAIRGNESVYCTAPTAAIMLCRYKKKAYNHQCNIYAYHQPFYINGVQITFIPAGHILGSSQVLLVHEGIRYLYTGDFKLQVDLTCEPLKFVQADVLITETTFADPSVHHPDPIEEIQKLNNKNHNILLGAYSLGKAQRITHLINSYCPSYQVLVHYSILSINKIYESLGYSLGKYEPYNRALMKRSNEGYIYIVPPLTFESYYRAKNVLRAFASGWKRLQGDNDFELLISDHADWSDLIKMINQTKPKQIWTVHGDGRSLKAYYENKLFVKSLYN